jgi:hypothetical protein
MALKKKSDIQGKEAQPLSLSFDADGVIRHASWDSVLAANG